MDSETKITSQSVGLSPNGLEDSTTEPGTAITIPEARIATKEQSVAPNSSELEKNDIPLNLDQKIRSLRYSPDFIRSKLNYQAIQIPGQLPIPNITMIDSSKKNSIITEMRKLFNIVTKTNVDEIKETLHKKVTEYIVKIPKENVEEGMNEIADEILHNFVVSESNISIYMQMLNKISNVVVIIDHSDAKTGKPILSRPIKFYFLNNCRTLIFKYISEEYIRTLAMKDQENETELDDFNKEKAKICNLIITICHLYNQRNSTDIQLSAIPLYNIILIILDKYSDLLVRMKKLGNPYEDEECENEIEYEYLSKMASMYSEHLIIFLDLEYEAFIKDTTIIPEKTPTNGPNSGRKLVDLVERFKKEVYPNISEPHLKIRCDKFNL